MDNSWLNIMSYHSPGIRFIDDQLDVMTDNSNAGRFGAANGRMVRIYHRDDGNTGSSTGRYRTVFKGATVATSGDIILIQGGNYNESRTFNQAVTLRATRGEATIGQP